MATKISVVAPIDLGKGIVRNERNKKYEVDLSEFVDGDTITYEDGKLKGQPQSSGLDCSAIGALKTVAMDKSIKVLGKKGDECVQVAVLDSIFQDVGVGMSASKYSGFVGDSFNVKITVSNTGEGTNENTTLSIIKPSLGSYTIQNQSHTSQGAGSVVKVSDTEYTIKNLTKGGTVIVTFDVIGSTHGTYQFSATVDPKSALDTNSANHRATISLNVNTKQDTNYVPTVECPYITATDVETDTPLVVRSLAPSNTRAVHAIRSNILASNAYWNRNNVSNLQVKLQNAYTVVVIKSRDIAVGYFSTTTRQLVVPRFTSSAGDLSSDNRISGHMFTAGTDYTFDSDTGMLTFLDTNDTRSTQGATIWARPTGINCAWQVIPIDCSIDITSDCSIVPDTSTNIEVINTDVTSSNLSLYSPVMVNIGYTGDVLSPGITRRNTTVNIKHPRGTSGTYTLRRTLGTCDLRTLSSDGNVKIKASSATETVVTVSANATPADTVKGSLFTVEVV